MADLRDDGPPDPPRAVYVHVPFCRDRCTYCAFPTTSDDPARHAELVDGLLREALRSPPAGPLGSLYLGGGTPALLSPDLLGRLAGDLCNLWSFRSDIELTLESNPASVSKSQLALWRALGVTRVSLGIQTFRDDVLHGLARRHDGAGARRALELVAGTWSGTWSADLLVGWHGQDDDALARDLEELLAFRPPHVSIYGLTVEPGTPLARRAALGHAVTASGERLEAFDAAWDRALTEEGYERYEVSNFALPGHRSTHNQAYWANASYIGLGPGATSYVHPHRWTNTPDLDGWLRAVARGHGLRVATERLDPFERLLETLAVGLRAADGLATRALDRRFGPGWRALLEPAAAGATRSGMLVLDAEQLRIPPAHLTKADRIVLELARGMREAAPRASAPEQWGEDTF